MSYEQEYFNIFTDQERKTIYDFFNTSSKLAKLNVYPNTQLPGMLWYHDHTMGSTSFNNVKGLKGAYILRDKEVESALPQGEYYVIFLLHHYYQTAQITSRLKQFKTDAWYWLRILDSSFGRTYYQIRFVTPDNEKVPFILIGQDSALMKTLVPNLTTFEIKPAERVDILIKFDSKKLKKGDIVNLHYRDW